MWCDWEWKWMTPAPTPPPAVSKRKGAVVRVSSWEHWCGGECLWTLAPGPSLALPVLGLGFPCVRARLVPLGGPGLLLAREFLRPRPPPPALELSTVSEGLASSQGRMGLAPLGRGSEKMSAPLFPKGCVARTCPPHGLFGGQTRPVSLAQFHLGVVF